MTHPPTQRTFLDRFAAGAAGTFVFAAFDVAVGSALGLGSIAGGEGNAVLAQVLAARAGVLALGVGCVVATLGALFGERRVDLRFARPSVATVVYAVAALVAFEALNWGLFRGEGIARASYALVLETAFRVLAIPLVPGVVFMIAAASNARRSRLFGAAMFLVALATLVVGARVYRTQYPALHLQAALGALSACVVGVDGLLRGTAFDFGRSGARVLVLAGFACVGVGGLRFAEARRAFAASENAAIERADALGRLDFLTRPVLSLVRRPPVATPDLADEAEATLRRLFDADDAAALARLSERVPGRRSMNVLLIALDTLRADRCGFLGYRTAEGRSPTPVLDALAEKSAVFERAYTSYPTSSYAFDGMFSSTAARATKVYAEIARGDATDDAPDRTLAGLLAAAGRKTAAISAFNRESLASPRGFKHLLDGFAIANPDSWIEAAAAPQVAASAVDALAKVAADAKAPFFMWVHFLDAHAPYLDHPEHRFGDAPHDWYLSEIAYADRHVGVVLDALDRLGRSDDTIVVVVSDHGEEFGERGGREHNGSVYDEQIRVPLVIRVPGLPPRKVTSTVSLLDVLPTLTRVLDVTDVRPRHGRPLVRHLVGEEDADGGFAYAEQFRLDGLFRGEQRRAAVIGRTKIIHRVHAGTFEVYDLDSDPGERRSSAGTSRAEPLMRAVLEAFDRRVDGAGARASADASAAFDEADRLFDRIKTAADRAAAAADPEEAKRAAGETRRALDAYAAHVVDPYGAVRHRFRAAFHAKRVDALFDRVAELQPDLPDGPAGAALSFLAHRGSPADVALFRKETAPLIAGDVPSIRPAAMEAAIALATRGDASVLDGLRLLYDSPDVTFKGPVATILARHGDFIGAPWYLLSLKAFGYGGAYRDAVLALPSAYGRLPADLGLPPASRFVRDRLTEERGRDDAIESAYVSALGAFDDEDAGVLLLRLARGGSESVRAEATAVLSKRFADASVLQTRLDAADDELTADGMALNLAFEEAAIVYRRALVKGGVFNAGLRFRLAAALAASGRKDAARAALQEIAASAPLAVDRDLAVRRMKFLPFPLMQNPEFFAGELVASAPPAALRPDQFFAVAVKLKNTGEEPWFGGYGPNAPRIVVRSFDANGAPVPVEVDADIQNRLPDRGVLPGEEVELLLVGWRPTNAVGERLDVVFENERMAYPNGGVLPRPAAGSRSASRPKGGG